MELSSALPLIYLVALAAVLGVIGLLVLREVLQNRRQEGVISRLQARLAKGKGTPEEHYELGGVYLEKKLYDLAIAQFRKSLDVAEEDIPLVCNGMGYTYFLQEQYDLAIRFYKRAVEADAEYVTAWNNLAHAYEKKNLISQAVEAYEAALALEPDSDIAKRRSNSLRKRLLPTESAAEK